MLHRVLEAEVMDTPAEARDYDSMDHAEVNRVFAADFLAAFGDDAANAGDAGSSAPPLVLDVGTGTAQIPIEVCRRGARLRIWGVDLAAGMLHLAKANVEVAGLTGRIRLDRVDAKKLPYPAGHFAAVVSNSIIHHIPAPLAALAEAVRVTEPGGLLFFRDLLRPEDDAAVGRLVETYAAGANDHQRQMFEDSLRAALSLREIQELVAALGFLAESVQRTTDRHWTWNARRV